MEKVSLSRLYKEIEWVVDPSDSRARERFKSIVSTMEKLVSYGVFREVLERGEASILDVMAASGICGVALAKVFVDRGARVELVVSDLRSDDLGLVDSWLDFAGISGRVDVETLVADATKLPEALSGRVFDVVTVWGSSLPHLDVYSLPLLVSGARELQPSHGVLVIEQHDILPRLLVTSSFKYILPEGKKLLTIYRGYDRLRGIQKRLAYVLPSLEYIGEVYSRLWDIAQIASFTWLFYKNIDLYSHYEPTFTVASSVIVAKYPRKNTVEWRELLSTIPTSREEKGE